MSQPHSPSGGVGFLAEATAFRSPNYRPNGLICTESIRVYIEREITLDDLLAGPGFLAQATVRPRERQ